MFLRVALYDASRFVNIRSSLVSCTGTYRTVQQAGVTLSSAPSHIGGSRRWQTRSSQHVTPVIRSKRVELAARNAKFDSLLWQLQTGLTEQNIQRIRESYTKFVEAEHQSPLATYTPRPRQREVLMETVKFLADLGQLDLLDMALDLMHTRCGMPVDMTVHQGIIKSFMEKGRVRATYEWLMQMRYKSGNVDPTVEMWNELIPKCRRPKVPAKFYKTPIACIRMSGCEPNEETFRAVLEVLFIEQRVTPPMETVKEVLQEMENAGFLGSAVIDGLVHAYSRAKVYEAVSELEGMRRNFDQDFVPQESRIATLIAEKLLSRDESDAIKLFKNAVRRGFQPDTNTLAIVSQGITTVRSLVRWEDLIGIQADTSVWETMIRNANEQRTAMEMYRTLLARDHRPSATMLLPILRGLCSAKWGPSSDSDIDTALALLRQYIDITDQPSKAQTPPVDHQDDLPLYNTVLRALTSSSDYTKYLSTATSLLEEVQTRNIVMDNMTRTSFIILAMKCASTAQEAFDIYRLMRRSRSTGQALDSKGHTAVLAAFSKHFFTTPSTFGLCLEMIRDMRQAGHHATTEVFSIILRQLAALASAQTDIEESDKIVSAIRRIHNFITVEASLKPDTILWNQLMDAYQRAGCFRDAYRVWETLFVSREFDYASVSIIWDACAFAGAYDIAKEIFLKLQRLHFVYNERNWSNWIECLCRLGRVEDATKVICVQMMEESKVRPTVKHIKLILRFASARNEENLVMSRIKRYLPDLYAEIDHNM